MEEIVILIVSFFIYCLLGWIWESVILPLSRKQKPYNRGFLNGPWIPIYGFGAILVIVLFDHQINYPFYSLFINGGVVACLLEYLTSYVMEKLFSRRWWDYSDKPFNLNGRICLEGFLCFGLFSVLAVEYVQPLFTKRLLLIDSDLLLIISMGLLFFFMIDVIVSVRVALKIDEKIEEFKMAIEDNEIKLLKNLQEKQVEMQRLFKNNQIKLQHQQIILKNLVKHKKLFKYSQRRLIRSFPDLLKQKKDKRGR